MKHPVANGNCLTHDVLALYLTTHEDDKSKQERLFYPALFLDDSFLGWLPLSIAFELSDGDTSSCAT